MTENKLIKKIAEGRMVFTILETEHDDSGYIPCIVVEGETGYYKTDWRWNCDLPTARDLASDRNTKMGIKPEDAEEIVLDSMFPNRKKKTVTIDGESVEVTHG